MAKLFSDLIGFLNAHPILWGYMVLGFATWIASIVVVLTSRMFLRKGLWLLLTLLSFTFSWGIGPGETLSLGIPLGSLIILGRRLFGRGPTAEEREDWEARRRLALAGSPAYAWRVWLLRTSYSLAVVATVVVGGLAASGAVLEALESAMGAQGLSGLAHEAGLADLWFIARLSRSAPVSREMTLNHLAAHSLGLPRSY